MTTTQRIGWAVVTAVALVGASACDGDADAGSESAAGPCRIEDLPTAGNRVSWFFGDVQQGRTPTIQGGVDDPLGCAYFQLCQAIQDSVSEEEFRDSQGEAVSPALSADSYSGARAPSGRYRRGIDELHSDIDTLDSEIVVTWKDADLTWAGQTDAQRWRIDLVREDGAWRVCGFTER